MCKEFFAGEWLNTQPLLYMASHMVIMPLILLFAFSCDWLARGDSALPAGGLGWLLAASYFSGIVIEVGRKIRAPEDEEAGVDTYSRVWGRTRAAVAWLFAVGLSAVFVCFAAASIDFFVPVVVVLSAMTAYAGFVVLRYTSKSDQKTAKAIETASGVFVLAVYAMVGIVPCFFGG
jgi:4-hydroxybenzoate polyprenyltransferase